MKVLVLSDIHANLTAFEAVLDAEPSFDKAVFLGDAVDYGPDPSACLERLDSLGPVRVRGNHDNAVAFGVDCGCSEAFREVSRTSRAFTRKALSPEETASLAAAPAGLVTELGGMAVRLVHATPRDSLFEYTSPDEDPARWAAAMTSDRPVDAVLAGHTHRPYVRRIGRLTVLNPGSVGQPRDGDPRASYALWEDGRFVLKRVSYDVAAAVARLLRVGLPPGVATHLAGILESGGS